MYTFLVVVIIGVVAAGITAYVISNKRAARRKSQDKVAASLGPDQNVENLGAGDILALWDGKESVVERIVDCQESLPGRVSHWKWAFLEGGQLLSITPSAKSLYTGSVILYQGSPEFEQLTGEAEDGGVLKLFELRVREGVSGSQPVTFDYEGQGYRVQSTGTFAVPDQPVPDSEVWSDVQVEEGQNVYFRMVGQDGAQVLGIWTSHIALYTGRALTSSDVRDIYHVEA
jgi:hypothetical protein